MDVLTPEQRQKCMKKVKAEDTRPEVLLRRLLWQEGMRYRKNYKVLPGRPDIALTKYRIAVFIDGEFWHGKDYDGGDYPGRKYHSLREQLEHGNNPEFWKQKIERNMQHDLEVEAELNGLGWKVIRFWSKEVLRQPEECLQVIREAVFNRHLEDENLNGPSLESPICDDSEHITEREIFMRTVNVVAAIICHEGKIFCTQRGYGEFKDGWEFPGGKVEPGETQEDAIVREIKEELGAEIAVDSFYEQVEYDYPTFHISMKCYLCHVVSGHLTLLEHEAATWLAPEELGTLDWLPADAGLIEKLKESNCRA